MKLLLSLLLLSACYQIQAQTPIGATTYDEAIDARSKPDEPGGVALVAKGGKIIYQRAFGMASLELNVPMNPDMVFEIGSMGKQFTAVCILQLMEQGKLALSDHIPLYISDCPASWQPVTIEHLLTHTSGITDNGARPTQTAKELVSQYQSKPLTFPPGSQWSYSSTGYALLGLIIEKVSGMSYTDYLQKNLITPLQLTHTYISLLQPVIPNRTPAYLGVHGRYRNVPRVDIPPGGGGALMSTTADMMKWTEALATGKVLKKETLAKAWTPYWLINGKCSYYGYGWQAGWKIQGSPIVAHGGLAVGFCTDAVYCPNEDIYVAVFMNWRTNTPELLTQALVAIALGKPDILHPILVSDSALKVYTGVYLHSDSSRNFLTIKEHQLTYQHENGPLLKLTPLGKDRFFFDNTIQLGIFKRDNNGQLTGLSLVSKRNLDGETDFFKRSDQELPAGK